MFALTTPFCRGDALGASRCRDTEAGTSVGGGALYRLTPYVAIGAVASFSWFGAPSASSAYSRSRWVGAVVRGYLLDRGALDPYVEAGFGVGAVDAGYDDGAHSAHSHASGPSTSATVGVDVWVLPYLRVGPALSYRWTWLHLVEQCVDGACTVDDVTTTGGVGSHMSFGLLATFALGREM
jgi:hypothetical protein